MGFISSKLNYIHPLQVRVCVVAGGTDQMIESQKLQNRPHIVVAMPGRLVKSCRLNSKPLKFHLPILG